MSVHLGHVRIIDLFPVVAGAVIVGVDMKATQRVCAGTPRSASAWLSLAPK